MGAIFRQISDDFHPSDWLEYIFATYDVKKHAVSCNVGNALIAWGENPRALGNYRGNTVIHQYRSITLCKPIPFTLYLYK
jgi:hypothetical protein